MKRFTVICIVIIILRDGSNKLTNIAAPSKRHQLPRMKRGMKKFEKSSMLVTITHGVPDYGLW